MQPMPAGVLVTTAVGDGGAPVRRGWSVGGWFRGLVERVKVALAVRAAEELEADARADAARRRAEADDLAAGYEAAGHPAAGRAGDAS